MYHIYLSGGITGIPNYKTVFKSAEDTLRAHGYEVVNPADISPPVTCGCGGGLRGEKHTWLCYMRYDLIEMLESDGVATLDRWEWSRGANVEVNLALRLGLRVAPVSSWVEWSKNESFVY